MQEQNKDWWLDKHTDDIAEKHWSKNDIKTKVYEMISMIPPSSGRLVDVRNKLVEIVQKMEIGEMNVEEADLESQKIFSSVNLFKD